MKTNIYINFILLLFMTNCFSLFSCYRKPIIKKELKEAHAYLALNFNQSAGLNYDKFFHFWISKSYEEQVKIIDQATVQYATIDSKLFHRKLPSRFNQKTKQGIFTAVSSLLATSVGIAGCYYAWLVFPKEHFQGTELLKATASFVGGATIIKHCLPSLYDGFYKCYRGITFKNVLNNKNKKSNNLSIAINNAHKESERLSASISDDVNQQE